MRGAVDGIISPHPLGEALPALFQEQDDFALAFTAALDEVVAPVFLALDNIDAYLDPSVAPADFLAWLAQWIGVELDETRPLAEQRRVVATSVELFSWRGTRRGLSQLVELYTGAAPEIEDSGGVSTSPAPDGPFPGSETPFLHIKVHVAPGREIDLDRLNEIVMAAKPAHLPHTIEVVGP